MTDADRKLQQDRMIPEAVFGTGDEFIPVGGLIRRVLEASRFSPRWLYRILWGHHRRPGQSRDDT